MVEQQETIRRGSINKLDELYDLANVDNQSINLIIYNRDKMLVSQNKDDFIQGYNDVNSNFLGKILID